jgi:putative DNA primase/helicase
MKNKINPDDKLNDGNNIQAIKSSQRHNGCSTSSLVKSDESTDETYQRLANLPSSEYDLVREVEAQGLGIEVTKLDEKIDWLRRQNPSANQQLEPWPTFVDGAELLDALAKEFRRFIILPKYADVILPLWVLLTYLWEWCKYSPILSLSSPVPECGKSRVLDMLGKVVNRPFRTGNTTEAVLFRYINSHKPTLLIDEFDSMPEDRRAAIGNILKNGFERSGCVHRLGGENKGEVVEFKVYGPKALACIKLTTLDGATRSRCIIIRMQRKNRAHKVERFRNYDATELRRKCLRWAIDHRQQIESGTAVMPDALGDREQDIYEPLFVIANLAGGDWPEKIRSAALALCGESPDVKPDAAVQLLDWIKIYFTETGVEKVSSASLVKWLNEHADAPFGCLNAGRGIDQTVVRRYLAGFDIHPETVRLGSQTAKGYNRAWFKDAFAAYLAETTDAIGNTVTTIDIIGDSPALTSVTPTESYQPQTPQITNNDAECYPVTNPESDNKEDTLYV